MKRITYAGTTLLAAMVFGRTAGAGSGGLG